MYSCNIEKLVNKMAICMTQRVKEILKNKLSRAIKTGYL